MKTLNRKFKRNLLLPFLLILGSFGGKLSGQQLKPSDFVLYGRDAVQISTSNSITGNGNVGSGTLIRSTGNVLFSGGLHSNGRIELANGNTVNGRISAANTVQPPFTGNILQTGTGAILKGDIYVNGNITIGGGTLSGVVYQPLGTFTYSGPGTAQKIADFATKIPAIGDFPSPITYPSNLPSVTLQANRNADLLPNRRYNTISLSGNRTITFKGPGTYVIDAITLTNSNRFIFDFTGANASDKFNIVVLGNMLLDKVATSFTGLPSGSTNVTAATRIFTEVRGSGNSSGISFLVANGSSSSQSRWLGTVWALNGSITLGSGTGNTDFTGALWSNRTVTINSGVNVVYSPLITECTSTTAAINAGAASANISCAETSIQLTGTTNISNPVYSWSTLDDKGNIIPDNDNNPATVQITTAGIYRLTVTNAAGCSATDDITVTSCINNAVTSNPFKVFTVVDAILTELINPNYTEQQKKELFIFDPTNPNRVLIEAILIAKNGNFNESKNYLYFKINSSATVNENDPSARFKTQGIKNDPTYYIITGFFPIAELTDLNTRPDLFKYVRAVNPPIGLNTVEEFGGQFRTGGDSSSGARAMRLGYGILGDTIKGKDGQPKKLKIGVLSDSYNMLDGVIKDPTQPAPPTSAAGLDISRKDLPAKGVELPDGDYPFPVPKTDEGRAMLQIIHEMAPGADLAFRTGFISEGDMAAGIRSLRTSGCDIIVDDITYATAPFFRDGLVTQAIKDVTADGAIYFTSAGNFGNKSYDGTIPASLQNGKANFFNGTDSIQQIRVNRKGSYMIILQWQDEFYSAGETNGTNYDLDIYLTDITGKNILGYNRNNEGSDPLEILSFEVDNPTTVFLKVVKAKGPSTPADIKYKYIIFRGSAQILTSPNQNPSTIIGHANAKEALTVGAVQFNLTPTFGVTDTVKVESFSSWGGFQPSANGPANRKPDFSAPDGVNTSVNLGTYADIPNGPLGPNGLPYKDPYEIENTPYLPFFGTSAAAPHAAGVAALLMNARWKFNPSKDRYTYASLRDTLQKHAFDITYAGATPGFDFRSGAGLIDGYKALLAEANPKPVLIKILSVDTTSQTPDGKIEVKVFVEGDYLTSSSYLTIGGVEYKDGQTIVDLVNKTLTVLIDQLEGNPPIQVCNDARATGDGGCSTPVSLLDKPKVKVSISPLPSTAGGSIQYGQAFPTFSYQLKIGEEIIDNDAELAALGYTREELGLEANGVSTVGFNIPPPDENGLYPVKAGGHIVTPFIQGFQNGIPSAFGLNFDYDLNPIAILVEKLKIKITPNNQTITYGSEPLPVTFKYEVGTGVVLSNLVDGTTITDKVAAEHNKYINETNAYALLSGDLNAFTNDPNLYNNLALMVTDAIIAKANGTGTVRSNGGGTVRSNVVDLSGAAIENFFLSRAFLLANGGGASRANGVPYELARWANGGGTVRSNGAGAVRSNAMVNAEAMINGFVSFNGLPPGELNADANGIRNVSGGNAAVANGTGTTRANGTVRSNYIMFEDITLNGAGAVRANVVVNAIAYPFANLIPELNGGGTVRSNTVESYLDPDPNRQINVVNGSGTVRSNTGEEISIANYNLFSANSNNNVAVLVDDLDILLGYATGYKSINMFTGLTKGKHKIIPGAFLPTNDNFEITYGFGELTVNDVALSAVVDNKQKNFGDTVIFTAQVTGYVVNPETDKIDSAGGIVYTILDKNNQVVPSTRLTPAGTYTIRATFQDPANYDTSSVNGTLRVLASNLTVAMGEDTYSIRKGEALPVFSSTITGLIAPDVIADETYLILNSTTRQVATQPLSAGQYLVTRKIDIGNLPNLANYSIIGDTAILTVDKATLRVKMDKDIYFNFKGDPLPAFSSTVTGLVAPDAIADNTYVIIDSITKRVVQPPLSEGHYLVTRRINATNLTNFNDYIIEGDTSTFYVNPAGGNTRSIRPSLVCIEVINGGSYQYRARYSYQNFNSSEVYVPLGDDNKIIVSAGASYSGNPPEVFLPGTYEFTIDFNGNKITWFLSTYEKNKKSAASSDATSTSNKCNSNGGVANSQLRETNTEIAVRETLYPNPANAQVYVEGDFSKLTVKDFMIMDVLGRQLRPQSIQLLSPNKARIEVSNLGTGQYFIWVNTQKGRKVFKFIKQ
ncbi:S8 family serine peptidase [Flavihumibacter rivuli]|uniref:T9SS type A sorting domain-containing protein n=1 Tax=Flavihumibacter rivuli TaxID=2838156 RepID=UPI001BDF6382|nr:T9SS type A sorting domain-containing protein [Flavihumibacter rivuli]ULQ58280.1 S8 family serine peptidase [Flavihumibacter rivuli]